MSTLLRIAWLDFLEAFVDAVFPVPSWDIRLAGVGGTGLPVGGPLVGTHDFDGDWWVLAAVVEYDIPRLLFACPSTEYLVKLFCLDVGGLTFPVL